MKATSIYDKNKAEFNYLSPSLVKELKSVERASIENDTPIIHDGDKIAMITMVEPNFEAIMKFFVGGGLVPVSPKINIFTGFAMDSNGETFKAIGRTIEQSFVNSFTYKTTTAYIKLDECDSLHLIELCVRTMKERWHHVHSDSLKRVKSAYEHTINVHATPVNVQSTDPDMNNIFATR